MAKGWHANGGKSFQWVNACAYEEVLLNTKKKALQYLRKIRPQGGHLYLS
jgi:hypothetical protein